MWELDVPLRVTLWEIFKGLLFIAITGLLFYIVTRRMLDRMLRSETSLHQSERARAALEKRLAQSQKLEGIGRVAGGIAHDFNNILTSILSASHLLQTSVADPAAQPWIKTIRDAADRGAGLTRQLLSFGRRGSPEVRPVNVNEVVSATVGVIRPLLAQNITLNVRLSPDNPMIVADESQLTQVLMNFCLNARDAMPDGGRIDVRAEQLHAGDEMVREQPEIKPGPHVLLTVSDNGSGMTSEVLDHMFEPFFTTKPRDKGTGLGLSTVYGIVRQSGGAIDVESEVGQGTTFRVYFPAYSANKAAVLDFPTPPVEHDPR